MYVYRKCKIQITTVIGCLEFISSESAELPTNEKLVSKNLKPFCIS